MVTAVDAARYLISLDPERKYFDKELVDLNGHTFYEGNARLNKILHLAQNIYIGKFNRKLINADFYAYANGGVIPEVQENYAFLLGTSNIVPYSVEPEDATFLRKVFSMLKDAPIKELIDIDHEDPAWAEKRGSYFKADQIMDSMKFAAEYSDMYETAIFAIDRIVC